MVAERPKSPVATRDIDQLMIGLEVHMAGLAQCIINPGWRLAFTAGQKTAIHYVVRGHGTMTVADFPPIELAPHSMVIVPSMLPVRIEISRPALLNTKCFDVSQLEQGKVNEIVAGSGGPELILMCGYFETSYGKSIDIFTTLTTPIVEQFDPADRLDQSLAAVLDGIQYRARRPSGNDRIAAQASHRIRAAQDFRGAYALGSALSNYR